MTIALQKEEEKRGQGDINIGLCAGVKKYYDNWWLMIEKTIQLTKVKQNHKENKKHNQKQRKSI